MSFKPVKFLCKNHYPRSMVKLTSSRLLLGDLISDDAEEKETIQKLRTFGFTEESRKDNMPLKFSAQSFDDFINQLRSTCTSDVELLDYVKNIVFWIYDEGILPLNVAIIEVTLKADDLQKLKKADLEGKIWKLSLFLGSCFSEGSMPLKNTSVDFRILKFSSRAIPNVALRNFVAEFIIEEERKFFDDFNKELDSLEKEISIRDSKDGRAISKDTVEEEQKIKNIRTNIISLEPVSFFEGGFSYNQSIVRGYANMTSIIGKIVQGSIRNSAPLYLSVLNMAGSQTPSNNLESMPVLQFPGSPPLLDFSFGAGQILALQLLNSWNRHVETLVKDITTKQNSAQMKANMDANKILVELRELIFQRGIDEKILVNYRRGLQNLADPSKMTSLYEFPIIPDPAKWYPINPEQYGLEKPGPIVSNLASFILKDLDLNEKHILDATDLRKSKIDVLKIEEDRKYSRKMLYLTVVIAIATIVNVVLFLIRL